MNDYQMLHLANATILERRAEAERSRLAATGRAGARTARSVSHKRGPARHLSLRSILGRA